MRAVVLLSGGLDSYTAAAAAKRDGYELFALTVRYGQVHALELESARTIAKSLGVTRHVEMDVNLAAFGGSSLVGDGDIPKGGRADVPRPPRLPRTTVASSEGGQVGRDTAIPSTYVPARNTIFLSLALAFAEVSGAEAIVIGVNAVDYSGYPDCRPEYIAAFERLASLATRAGVEGRPLRILTPLQHLSKAEIIRLGVSFGLDYGLTLSCYAPSADGRPCGTCDSCLLRARGFAEAALSDPVLSRDIHVND